MSNQVELKAEISDELVETLSDYFLETESANWGNNAGRNPRSLLRLWNIP